MILRCLERDPALRPGSALRRGGRAARRRPARGGARGRRDAVAGDGGGGRRDERRQARPRPLAAGGDRPGLLGVAGAVRSRAAHRADPARQERRRRWRIARAKSSRNWATPTAGRHGARTVSSAGLPELRHADRSSRARGGTRSPTARSRRCVSGTHQPPGADHNREEFAPTFGDPPMIVSNMVAVVLDTQGRLTQLNVVPPQVDGTDTATACGLDPRVRGAPGCRCRSSGPSSRAGSPIGYADQRAAWEGPLPGQPQIQVRAEAARTKAVRFLPIVGPWTRPARMEQAPRRPRHPESSSLARA